MRGALLLFALACAGCGDPEACAECDDPGSRLIDALSNASYATAATCGTVPLATDRAPTVTAPQAPPCQVVRPGGMLYAGVSWIGGTVARLHLGFGGCRYLSVRAPVGLGANGTIAVAMQVAPTACDGLPRVCHPLEGVQAVETVGGAVSRTLALPVLLDCSDGNGCLDGDDWVHTDAGWLPGDGGGETCSSAPGDMAMPPVKRVTGEPCVANEDCLGQGARCIVAGWSVPWPQGYCTSSCDPSLNDGDELNNGCPGLAVCDGSGSAGDCFAACTAATGGRPCRDGYGCFFGCRPLALSQCDPTQPGGCQGDICEPAGLDLVGQCAFHCDPFLQDCGQGSGCYASPWHGGAACVAPIGAGHIDGAHCDYYNHCDPGFGCWLSQAGFLACGRYCGGAKSVPCPNGQTCRDLSPTVPSSVIGVCIP